MARQHERSDTGTAVDLPSWRSGMKVRGGRIAHMIARAGWLVFGLLGAALMVAVTVLWTVSPSAEASDNSPAANFIGGLILFMPTGAVIFGLLGLGAQFWARAWLRSAPPIVSDRRARGWYRTRPA